MIPFYTLANRHIEYLAEQNSDRAKRNAVGTYANSGLSAYQVPQDVLANNHTVFDGPNGPGFPVTWDPRYTIAHGWAAIPDKREDFHVNDHHERIPAVRNSSGYFFNPQDNPQGFSMTGNIGTGEGQGVHSLVSYPYSVHLMHTDIITPRSTCLFTPLDRATSYSEE